MPVDTPHPEYHSHSALAAKCLVCYQGQDAVKAKGEVYLPKLDQKQEDPAYKAYKRRAAFYEATGRTVGGLIGATIRKTPQIVLPEALDGLVMRDDLKRAVRALLLDGRFGLLVDRPAEGDDAPYITMYKAGQIINWHQDKDGKLDLVVLKEDTYKQKDEDRFTVEPKVRYRELALGDPNTPDATNSTDTGTYFVNVWAKTGDTWEITETIIPQQDGKPLQEIPFFFCSPDGLDVELHNPPILSLANANLDHYRTNADRKWALHFTACPTPWFSAFRSKSEADKWLGGQPLTIGSSTAWMLPENSKVSFLSHSGEGLADLREELEAIEKRMASLGARFLEGRRSGVEAAETARLRQAGETATLVDLVVAVNAAYTAAARFAAEWYRKTAGKDDEIVVEMSQDFVSTRLSPEEIKVLLESLQASAISFGTFWHNLVQGEIAPEGVTAEDEQTAIDEELPPLGGNEMNLDDEDGEES